MKNLLLDIPVKVRLNGSAASLRGSDGKANGITYNVFLVVSNGEYKFGCLHAAEKPIFNNHRLAATFLDEMDNECCVSPLDSDDLSQAVLEMVETKICL